MEVFGFLLPGMWLQFTQAHFNIINALLSRLDKWSQSVFHLVSITLLLILLFNTAWTFGGGGKYPIVVKLIN